MNTFFLFLQKFLKSWGFLRNPTLSCISQKKSCSKTGKCNLGFDPTNPSRKRSMCGLMIELNNLLSTEYQLDVNGISNNKISYVRVPQTQSDRSFLNSKEWVDTAIQIAGSKRGVTFESAKRITNHIIRYYWDSFLAAWVPVSKPMSATQFQAMLCAGGVSGTGERELKIISVLTSAKASVPPEEASTCCLRTTAQSIMAVLNLPTRMVVHAMQGNQEPIHGREQWDADDGWAGAMWDNCWKYQRWTEARDLTTAMVALHTSYQLCVPAPPLWNWHRKCYLLSSSMQQASFKCEMPWLELTSSWTSVAIKHCQRKRVKNY